MKKLVMKPIMFRDASGGLVITKSWVSNGHWVVHKSLLADPLTWLTYDTAITWLNLVMASISHIAPSRASEDTVNNLVKDWKSKGSLHLAPEPEPGIYHYHPGGCKHPTRVVTYNLPEGIRGTTVGVPKFCIRSVYYKAFTCYLTHMIYVPETKTSAHPPDKIADTSICNKDMTFILRPLRGLSSNYLERVKRSKK